MFFRGVVSNKFNQPELSIKQIRSYLGRGGGSERANLLRESYEILADNYVKTYPYRKAAEAHETLLTKFRGELDAEEVEDFENSLKLWGALSRVPKQSVTFNVDSIIRTSKDKASFTNLPVVINGESVAFVFDTGANYSVVTNSFANKLGFKIIDAPIKVGAITGNMVIAKLGVVPELKLGRLVVHNAVFMVFDDKDLAFPQINYQINGIIGLPIIECLREVTLSGSGEITIPARAGQHRERNMCLDGLTPLVSGTFKGKRLSFTFDTGAQTSHLNPVFYIAYEDEIKAGSTPQTERMGGAGGYKGVTVYLAKNLEVNISGKSVRFDRIKILTDPLSEASRYFHGNLGQDVIKQFDKMTINFESMSLVFN